MPQDSPPFLLTTPRLHLALLPPDAAARMLSYYTLNREHLGPVSPDSPPGLYTLTYWRTRLAQDAEDWRHDSSLRLALLPRELPLSTAPVIGTVSLMNLRRGPLQTCELGFGLDRDHQGRGLMSEALRIVCDYAFLELGLHRIHANHLPENQRSAAVLRRLGFAVEGYARELVLIGGRWRDHVLTALVAPPPPA